MRYFKILVCSLLFFAQLGHTSELLSFDRSSPPPSGIKLYAMSDYSKAAGQFDQRGRRVLPKKSNTQRLSDDSHFNVWGNRPASRASGRWAVGSIAYGGAVRYRTAKKTAWEIRGQYASDVFAVGPRFYYYFGSGSGFALFCVLEGDYIGFKGRVSKGFGLAGGVALGGEVLLTKKLAISLDFGPVYLHLRDSEFSESAGGVEYVINGGIYWYFK